MCGIVGYVGKKQACPILLAGLERLEYRGYDSAGVAVMNGDKITCFKSKGRLKMLSEITDNGKSVKGCMGIGHTRWATHGVPNDINSHPHLSADGKWAVVHNGIIENYLELKEFLLDRGFMFASETDTEVIAHLLEYYDDGNLIHTLARVIRKLRGSYALGVMNANFADRFIAARKDSPLVIGLGAGCNFIASDMPAILEHTRQFILLEDNEIAVITAQKAMLFDINAEAIVREPITTDYSIDSAEKNGYPHFMLKEIYEQPHAIKKTVASRIESKHINLDKFTMTPLQIKSLKRIHIVGCGSAYHAGMVGKYFIEKLTRLPVEVDIASEYRYREPITDKDTLTIIISQSGETADTLAALREARKLGARVLSIVNVVGSSIARESDDVLYTWAGAEIAVATTKGYTTQVASLYLIGIYIAQSMASCHSDLDALTDSLADIDKLLARQLQDIENIQYLASTYHGSKDAYFLGRGIDYAVALEGSLKLKEISYIHAEAYAAGELKHGTISLIEQGSLVVAIATDPLLIMKTISNIIEVKSRGATVIGLSTASLSPQMKKACDHIIEVDDVHPYLSPLLSVVQLQLFAYYVSNYRGLDVDKPRNLAKSVTVE